VPGDGCVGGGGGGDGGGAARAVGGGVASRPSREHRALEVERGDGLELVRQLRAHAVPLALRGEGNANRR
jgi:hypothetical protein